MSVGRRIVIASRKTDLTWALHHEIARHEGLRLVANIDPRASGALDRTVVDGDVVVIEAEDLLWLWREFRAPAERLLKRAHIVVVLADGELLDIVTRAQGKCGILLRAKFGDVPADTLELAILGYIIVSPALLATIVGDGLRLALVDAMTDDERAVLAQLGHALSNRRIAAAIGCTEARAKTLVHLVTRKLRLSNRTGVAVFSSVNGFAAAAAQ